MKTNFCPDGHSARRRAIITIFSFILLLSVPVITVSAQAVNEKDSSKELRTKAPSMTAPPQTADSNMISRGPMRVGYQPLVLKPELLLPYSYNPDLFKAPYFPDGNSYPVHSANKTSEEEEERELITTSREEE